MKTLIGKVVSNKMQKTIIVEIERKKLHPLYKKVIKRTKRFKVHCENKKVALGDYVKIGQIRPKSKEKHYQLLEIIKK